MKLARDRYLKVLCSLCFLPCEARVQGHHQKSPARLRGILSPRTLLAPVFWASYLLSHSVSSSKSPIARAAAFVDAIYSRRSALSRPGGRYR